MIVSAIIVRPLGTGGHGIAGDWDCYRKELVYQGMTPHNCALSFYDLEGKKYHM